jgi:hypothetical protein
MPRHPAVTLTLGLLTSATLLACVVTSPLRVRDAMPARAFPKPVAHRVQTAHGGPCNGAEVLCDRRYDEVAYPTTHNAMSNGDDQWFKPNQQHGVWRQLRDGVRALMLDTHYSGGTAYLCHGFCAGGRKPLLDELVEIRAFLDANPREVLTLLIQPNVTARDTAEAFVRSGLDRYAFTHGAGEPWPTLGEMIASGRRLVVFAEEDGGSPAWYHDLWRHAWETPYAFAEPGEFTCAPNRGQEGAALFILNHFITDVFPSEAAARAVNGELLGERAEACAARAGRVPNFVTVDFYAEGDLFEVVDRINGVDRATTAVSEVRASDPAIH